MRDIDYAIAICYGRASYWPEMFLYPNQPNDEIKRRRNKWQFMDEEKENAIIHAIVKDVMPAIKTLQRP